MSPDHPTPARLTDASGLRVLLYGDVDLNVMDGSATWLPSMAETLARTGAAVDVQQFFATLTDVHWSMSGEVVLMTLVGGLGTVFGPVVGAAVIVTMQNYLAELGAWVTVIQGVIFVTCVLAFRRGIIGELGNLLKVKL